MKFFFVNWESNYGTGAMVVSAFSLDDARLIALAAGAWDNLELVEINTKATIAEVLAIIP